MMDNARLHQLLSPEYMATALLKVRKHIVDFHETNGERAFDLLDRSGGRKKKKKTMYYIDLSAETFFKNCINAETKAFSGREVEVLGEESIQDAPNLRGKDTVCMICDIIDGTDLLYRDMANWCSAVTVFTPARKRIEGSYVAIESASGFAMYYALNAGHVGKLNHPPVLRPAYRESELPAKRARQKSLFRDASGLTLSKAKRLSDVSLCVNTQKGPRLRSFLELRRNEVFIAWLDRIRGGKEFRFYNLAGNPMMARMAEGKIGVVMDLVGQLPHDVIPGVMIARSLGAIFGTPDGRRITDGEILDALCEPNGRKIKYILAANEALYNEAVRLVSGKAARVKGGGYRGQQQRFAST